MTPLRIGVVGVGHLGTLHARKLSALQGVTLGGVHDRQPERARQVARDLHTVAFADLEALLEAVDAITVATPTGSHFEVARRAIECGKHLFIEKPITATVGEADMLCREATRRGLIVQVGHVERFNPAVLAMERFAVRPLFIESHRLAQFRPRGSDVAVVLDLMIHDIDLILHFVRAPVRQVDANGVSVVSDTVDIANARLQFENGCVANVTASRISQRPMRKMRLFQPNSYVSIDFSEGRAEVFRLVGEDEPKVRGTVLLGEVDAGTRKRRIVYEQPKVRKVDALSAEFEQFAESVRTGTPPRVTAEDGKRALVVASAILERINEQRLPV
jgi:predicted dehydrogenase